MTGKWGRRAITIPIVALGFLLVTALLPALVLVALVVDVGRRRGPVAVRIVGFLWVYLAGQLLGLAALFWVWLRFLPSPQRWVDATFQVQTAWASALFRAVSVLFRLELEVEGDDALTPGPYLVFIRHASIIDTLLPSVVVTARHGVRLRFVLKRELLVDPCLDVAGLRLPNAFVSRTGEDGRDIDAVRALSRDLGPNDGILIYPEGTRFDMDKQRRVLEKLRVESPATFPLAKALTHVLPPRLGGALALLEGASEADAVFVAHTGLDGFARIADIFDQALDRRRVAVKIWRVPRAEIPASPDDRVRWLFEEWQKVNDWVAARSKRGAECLSGPSRP